ncbi:MAG TPA: GNAT family N-acetyltransferase [Labilithrix sp.]|nr:GNAT family N-acetyltransferase [Labilithrix sp.]
MVISTDFPELTSLDDVRDLRTSYLDALPKAQDALLETIVATGRVFGIVAQNRLGGYFVVVDDKLVEYHVSPELETSAHLLFPKFVLENGIRSALVKTFDHVFLSCALDIGERVTVRGVLVRDYVRRELPDVDRIRYTRRTATRDDLPRVIAVEQDVFTHPERLRTVVENGHVELFEHDGELIGFCLLRPVIAGRPDIEVGIAIDTKYRNKGYAIYMLREAADLCTARGLNPVSGCARTNEPSIRTGLRVGFSGRYRLIEIRFRDAASAPAAT